jgi:hypothetical protein
MKFCLIETTHCTNWTKIISNSPNLRLESLSNKLGVLPGVLSLHQTWWSECSERMSPFPPPQKRHRNKTISTSKFKLPILITFVFLSMPSIYNGRLPWRREAVLNIDSIQRAPFPDARHVKQNGSASRKVLSAPSACPPSLSHTNTSPMWELELDTFVKKFSFILSKSPLLQTNSHSN